MNQMFRYHLLDQLLDDLLEEIEIPESSYVEAERSYRSVGEWLDRPESSLHNARPVVHVQGSFALGLAIKPLSEDEDYDVDAVCELRVSKRTTTQEGLKEALGRELRLYVKAHNMSEDPERKNRCWTLNYAEGAQFHLDSLPGVPDGDAAKALYLMHHIANPWAETSIAITDERHPNFKRISDDWLRSNPRGYAHWFRSRQKVIFQQKKMAIAARIKAKVEDLPEYKVKTPLQSAIQILKRHRDVWAADEPGIKPISIIVTTLAAHAYQQEATVAEALVRLLSDMDKYIGRKGRQPWIANPSDPLENFADKWCNNPDLERAFFRWLAAAREDFARAAQAGDPAGLVSALSPCLGDRIVRAAARKRIAPSGVIARLSRGLQALFSAPHRKPVPWPEMTKGDVRIVEAKVSENGYRPKVVMNDGAPVRKNASVRFVARTTIQGSFQVYWQVVNTGAEATRANGLRGTFEELPPERGVLTKVESTSYMGTHSIQCFIVQNGWLVAKSEPFVVNIL